MMLTTLLLLLLVLLMFLYRNCIVDVDLVEYAVCLSSISDKVPVISFALNSCNRALNDSFHSDFGFVPSHDGIIYHIALISKISRP